MVNDDSLKTVWLINQYASTPETGIAGRHYYFAKELAKRGYKVYLITAGFNHLLRQPPDLKEDFTFEAVSEGFHVVWVKMPKYKGAHSYKRVLNWFEFSWKLLKLPKVITDKPNSILYSSPSLIPFWAAKRLSRTLKAKLIWDVRDIWPLTLTELGGMSRYHPFILLHQFIESYACRRSDFIISNLPFAIKHLVDRGVCENNFLWIPNGFYAEEFFNGEVLSKDVSDLIPLEKFLVGYTGTFGKANAIDSILNTAVLTKSSDEIHYVLVGGGSLESHIEEFIYKNELKNITLIKSIPKRQIPAMLALFDVCYVGFNKCSLYQFGTALNKLPEYMMSAKPILYSIDSIFRPVDDANCGLTVPAEDSHAIAQGILTLKNLSPEERCQMGENGRAYALKNHDYSKLASKLERLL